MELNKPGILMCPQSLYQPFMSGPQAVQRVQQSARPGAKSPKHNGKSFQWSPGLKRRFRRAARSTRRRIAALAGSGYYSVSVTVTSVSLVPHLGRWPSPRLRSRRNSLVCFRQSRHEPVAKCFADNGFASLPSQSSRYPRHSGWPSPSTPSVDRRVQDRLCS